MRPRSQSSRRSQRFCSGHPEVPSIDQREPKPPLRALSAILLRHRPFGRGFCADPLAPPPLLFLPRVETSFSAWITQSDVLRDKDWAQVVKTNHFPPSLFSLGTPERKRVSAQAKPISEVVKDFEQSLENLRPSTRRVYVAGARAAIRAASLELWQSPSATELLASSENPPPKRAHESRPSWIF